MQQIEEKVNMTLRSSFFQEHLANHERKLTQVYSFLNSEKFRNAPLHLQKILSQIDLEKLRVLSNWLYLKLTR